MISKKSNKLGPKMDRCLKKRLALAEAGANKQVTGTKMKKKQKRSRSLHDIYKETSSSDIYNLTLKDVEKLSKETQSLKDSGRAVVDVKTSDVDHQKSSREKMIVIFEDEHKNVEDTTGGSCMETCKKEPMTMNDTSRGLYISPLTDQVITQKVASNDDRDDLLGNVTGKRKVRLFGVDLYWDPATITEADKTSTRGLEEQHDDYAPMERDFLSINVDLGTDLTLGSADAPNINNSNGNRIVATASPPVLEERDFLSSFGTHIGASGSWPPPHHY